MAITDRDRRDLYDGLEQTIGADKANTLMQLLPMQPANELVTTTHFQAEMAVQRSDLRAEMADLRTDLKGEMAGLRTELKDEMADLRTELKYEMAHLRVDVTTQLSRSHDRFNRLFTASIAANVVAVVTALVA